MTTVELPNATSVPTGMFYNASPEKTVTWLKNISAPKATSLANRAFFKTGLVSASFPSVTEIGTGAFNGCTDLTSVTLPKVTKIEVNAFGGCTNLTTVTLGTGFTEAKAITVTVNLEYPAFTNPENIDLILGQLVSGANGNAWGGFTWKSITQDITASTFAELKELINAATDNLLREITLADEITFTQVINIPTNKKIKISGRKVASQSIRNTLSDNIETISGNSSVQLFTVEGELELDNLILTNATTSASGGAVFVKTGGKLVATNCTFAENSATVNGGAVAVGGTFAAINCTFKGNSAVNGGAIASSGNVYLYHCTFDGNEASTDETAIRIGNGGTLYSYNCIYINSTVGDSKTLITKDGENYKISNQDDAEKKLVWNLFEGAKFGKKEVTIDPGYVFGENNNYIFDFYIKPKRAIKAATNIITSANIEVPAGTTITTITTILEKDQRNANRSKTRRVTYGSCEAGGCD